ncbi:mammalian cell entry protein [Mycolicibacterium neoaurum]|uniref:mammalian cell entry protein n=1 Tax=Mycolicibacterium neoaurum TaxID=1795 RepID=UPI00248B60A6|nr:mammalian cell entry protein [Mycolicibacterium neoaurum]WBP95323.1 mammalian cell entry protein [Mycolicibacterium neoaurum]WBS08379.1 mammalian cell entry protein [Mycolicibacterium neoaurum]
MVDGKATDNTDTDGEQTRKVARRRASRAAGPAGAGATAAATTVPAPPNVVTVPTPVRAAALPPRKPHRALVSLVSAVAALVAAVMLVTAVVVLTVQRREAAESQARDQRFVDTASQTVMNMFSYDQNSIDESVNRFVDGTSGPLRDMMSQDNNIDNLKAIFRDTNASSEAVISGAALEKVDEIGGNASVLVSVRVTVTDIDGVDTPSQPYRMRVIVHEDGSGHMTGYDLKYPEGGN